jgi:hypothetical protein
MKKFQVKKIRILERAIHSSAVTSLARALRLINNESPSDLHSQTHTKELLESYIPYDELRKIRLQILEVERQKAEAISLTRRRTCT